MGIDLTLLDDPDGSFTVDGDRVADYSESSENIIADLATAEILTPIFNIAEQPQIMAVGDSITSGEHPNEPHPGAYRLQLKDNFAADDLNIDLIGSQTNQNTELEDREHEGHPGWKIDELTGLVEGGLLNDYQPDIVLLMAGTNDILHSDSAGEVIDDLEWLIDRLMKDLGEVPILVSSLVPIDPEDRGEPRASVVPEVNRQLPELAARMGDSVTYVDAGGRLELKDLVTDGIHPDAEGYAEIANGWYSALVPSETIADIDHLVGTSFGDRLTGNDAANALVGNGGADTLNGGGGADRFVYEFLDGESDIITDFEEEDRLVFSAAGLDAGLTPDTELLKICATNGVYFSSSTHSCSVGTNATFFYETETGTLSFNPDGTGSTTSTAIATFTNEPTLDSEQFIFTA